MPAPDKTVVIIAGPNGAGKTTFARAFLAQSRMRFINADLIAAGLSPFEPERMALRAGRVALYFLLKNIETAMDRVATRVLQGGHSIPQTVMRHRFVSGLHNFERHYKHAVNAWGHYDSSDDGPIWRASGENQ